MNIKAWIFLLGYCCWWIAAAGGAEDAEGKLGCAEIQQQMEAAAKSYSHFATEDLIGNRSTESRWPAPLAEEQTRLQAELRRWAQHPDCLATLLKSPDAKVRTLALGALYLREDPQDLPLIAALANDPASTLPDLHDSAASEPGPLPLADFESAQSVGTVAREMLLPYLRAANAGGITFTMRGTREIDGASVAKVFADYWQARAGRKSCASWFVVKMDRATHSTEPLPAEAKKDVERVAAAIRALPVQDRAWTEMYVRAGCFTKLDEPLPERLCVADLQAIGPEPVLRFLQRQRVNDDPDLWFDELGRADQLFGQLSSMILRHARELLRGEDAPALLACEEKERQQTPKTRLGASPAWAAAAADLTEARDPAAATAIIDAALERYPLAKILGGVQQSVLMAELWRQKGMKAEKRIVEWFYQVQAQVKAKKRDESNHGPLRFLQSVRAAARPDTDQLIATLILDPRLADADWALLKELLELASQGQPTPLVSNEDIYKAWPPRGNSEKALEEWRTLLRHRYATPAPQ